MRTQSQSRAPIQFSTLNPENIIAIENHGNRVTFRAAYDNFSIRRKAFLIRELAAEGYIPDRFEYVTEDLWDDGLTWLVDRSLAVMGVEATRRCNRAMQRLLLTGCALWLAEITILLLGGR